MSRLQLFLVAHCMYIALHAVSAKLPNVGCSQLGMYTVAVTHDGSGYEVDGTSKTATGLRQVQSSIGKIAERTSRPFNHSTFIHHPYVDNWC
jgi:hypothetical protein